MNTYTAVSLKNFISKNSTKVLSSSDLVAPFEIKIPDFLPAREFKEIMTGFSFIDKSIKKEYATLEPIPVLEFPSWSLQRDMNGYWNIKFKCTRTDKWFSVQFVNGYTKRDKNLDVEFIVGTSQGGTKFKRIILSESERLRPLPSCHQFHPAGCKGVLNIGLTNRLFHITMNGKMMDGECYVFICGLMAIILRDDLSVDAICVLDATALKPRIVSSGIFGEDYTEGSAINITDIIWTKNPYIVKFKLMIGR